MTLQQLRYLCEIADRGFSVSRAAAALHISQPSMSRQIQALERELGITILERGTRRMLGLTAPGAEVLAVARKMLRAADGMARIRSDWFERDTGTLVVTTSHTHARYVLPTVIQRFRRAHPGVRVTLRQGNPRQVAGWVADGLAEFSICSRPPGTVEGVALLPCHTQQKIVLVPRRHPLLRSGPLAIETLAAHPLITYTPDFTTHDQVMRAFAAIDREPDVILSAADVDVMKAYVKCGLGVAIVAASAYDPKEDRELRALDASHLFEPNRIYVGIRLWTWLRAYAYDFLALFAPSLTRERVDAAVWPE